MGDRTTERASPPGERDYPKLLRGSLLACAIALALLPIPVTWFRLLPVYEMHARFLIFYAPVVCLLLLGYLLYVRDGLARLMFANILNPLPEADPYYRMPVAETLRRRLRQVQATVLTVLPVVLVATSSYCLFRYTDRLRESAAAASVSATELPSAGEEVGRALPETTREPARRARADSAGRGDSATSVAPQTAAVPTPDVPPREWVLRTAQIDAIPLFTELTVLYIGIFAAALLAVLLMALKEHAKEAMGLTEQELVVGRYASSEETLAGPLLAPPGE